MRLATIRDIPRIAEVATAGFYYSPVFQWERPNHSFFPTDTIESYQKEFATLIRDPEYIGIVIEDLWDPKENNKTNATVPDYNDQVHTTSTVVVGVASWKLQPNSSRQGQFMDLDDQRSDNPPSFERGHGRDRNKLHGEMLDKRCNTAEEKLGLFLPRVAPY